MGTILPSKTSKEMKALGVEETRRFLEEASSDRWGLLFTLAIYTDMRPGEIRALQWKDIDFQKKVLTVQRAVSKGRNGWYFKPTKTKQVRRNPLPEGIIERLKVHRKEQTIERERFEGEFHNNDLVFANEAGLTLDPTNLIQRHFKPILERAGLPRDLRWYDLRHTMATLLLHTDENIKVISERLGHADATMTLNIYAHVLPTMQEAATQKLDALLREQPESRPQEEDGVG